MKAYEEFMKEMVSIGAYTQDEVNAWSVRDIVEAILAYYGGETAGMNAEPIIEILKSIDLSKF